ncbi:Hypothetical protein A7982_07577 [Minicystis rosea]|nr:Hypothetical protein A7982_07577 [Minicystis rosea]
MLFAAALLALVACSNKKDKDDGAHSAEPPSSAPPPSAAPAPPPPPAIEAHVKVELDNRPDGVTGAPLAITGAHAMLLTPTGWTPAKGEFTVLSAPDKKAQIAAGAISAAETADAKLPAAVAALGLTECQWGPPEPLVVGKNKLASMGADGVCKRGPIVVRTAYVAPTAERLLAVGAWEPGGDSANVFGAMRSIIKPPTGDTSGLGPCCAALRQNARSAPPDQRGYLLTAAAVCDGLRNNPQGRAMAAQMRAQLRGAALPAPAADSMSRARASSRRVGAYR